ncbi:hypothetical protein MKX03_015711 [Papaver bracteatum]|nr:hypothetical protein MKX03_015711 [Papaver bracteatum]
MNFIVFLTLALLIHVCQAQTPEDFLAPHNAARAEVNVAPLVWNETVATYASNYANQLAGNCTLVLSGGPYSENLALVSGALSIADHVEQLWHGQKSNYDYESNSFCRNSVSLGCAVAFCNNGDTIVACNYDPPCIAGELVLHKQPIMNFIVFLTLALLIHVCEAQTPEDFLAPHNAARAEVNVAPLVWNETVATYASNYANQLAGNCTLVLSGGPYSENLALVSGALSTADHVEQLWLGQKSNYEYESNSCQRGPENCLQYINVVCRNSVSLGCAVAFCNNGDTIVSCNYDPPCIAGERPY